MGLAEAAMLTCGTWLAFTVMVMLVLLAVALVTHVSELVNWQATTSLLLNVLEVKVLLFPACAVPFTVHVKLGDVPPLVAVAVKVTDVPAQIAPVGNAVTDTVGVNTGFTVMVMLLLAAVADETQLALLVNVHCTTALLVRVVVVKEALLVPAGVPFTVQA